MFDLHTHSTASDGTLSPAALVDRAADAGLTALALTDHDTLAGIDAARARAAGRGLRFLAGIELSCIAAAGADVHILGYGIADDSGPLLRLCSSMRVARAARAQRILAQLVAAGAPLALAAVQVHAQDAAIGRPHIARALVDAGFAPNLKHAFERWLVPGAPGFVPLQRLAAADAIGLIQAAGGVAVLAHPGALHFSTAALSRLLAELRRLGLSGLEVYWSQHRPLEVRTFEFLASVHGLFATGGSDFHGANKPDIELGRLAGGKILDPTLLDRLDPSAHLASGRA